MQHHFAHGGRQKLITRPVVSYRKKVVRVGGNSTFVLWKTITDSRTSSVSRSQTDVETVTRPVTVTFPGTTQGA